LGGGASPGSQGPKGELLACIAQRTCISN
jgi:hypothetical protein